MLHFLSLVFFFKSNLWYFLLFEIDLVPGLFFLKKNIICYSFSPCLWNPGYLHSWKCSVCKHLTYSWDMDWDNLLTRRPPPEVEWIWWWSPCVGGYTAFNLICPSKIRKCSKMSHHTTIKTSLVRGAVKIKDVEMASECFCLWKSPLCFWWYNDGVEHEDPEEFILMILYDIDGGDE